jgi:hypothetical protein
MMMISVLLPIMNSKNNKKETRERTVKKKSPFMFATYQSGHFICSLKRWKQDIRSSSRNVSNAGMSWEKASMDHYFTIRSMSIPEVTNMRQIQ